MKHEDAVNLIVHVLAMPEPPMGYSSYGYDLYIPNAIRMHTQDASEMDKISPVFFDAAWELCRRGILRPGVRKLRSQATDEGSAGAGFSVTPFGREWLKEAEKEGRVARGNLTPTPPQNRT